jgi:hypothetical protein
MKRPFAWLFPLGAIAATLSFPMPAPILGLAAALVVVALVTAGGLYFGSPHDLGSDIPTPRRGLAALLIGAVCGGLVLAMLPLLGLEARMKMDGALPVWQRLVMSFDAAVLEELIFRLFVVSLVVWICARFMRRNPALWVGIAVAALAFAAVHLPRWMAGGPSVIAGVMIVNAIPAVALGLVYTKWGIEAAMLSHFAADVLVHVAGPYLYA